MTVNKLIPIFLVFLLAGCTIRREYVTPQTNTPTTPTTPTVPGVPPELQIRTTVGEWTADKGGAGGTNKFDTFKNYQYTLEVAKNNQKVDITLTSADIDVQFALFDPLGQLIGASDVNRSPVNAYTVNAGTYRIVVCAARRAVGKFTLTVVGSNSDPSRIPGQILQSNTQNWGPLGGGGNDLTYKNHFYSFTATTDNTSVDIELESADTDVALFVYNGLGQQIDNYRSGSRYTFQILPIDKGAYTIMAATSERGSKGSYNLRVTGKVDNLTKADSQSAIITGQWSGSSQVDQYNYAYEAYTLQLTDNTNLLDLEITSADTFVELYLESLSGVQIENHVQSFLNNRSYKIVETKLPKGLYKITARASRGRYGTYTLNVFGRFTDLKKI